MALKKIKSATITRIALCRRGKNGFKTLLKSDGTAQLDALVKATEVEGELLSVVYAPERADADGDFADAPVIKAFAHTFLRDHRALDIEHNGAKLPDSAAYVAESFIVAKGDERFINWKDYDGKPVGDLTGAWATVIRIDDPTLRKAYASGEWDGVSMFGQAAIEHVDVKAAAKAVADRLAAHQEIQEIQMNKEELLAALAAAKAETVALIKSTVAELMPKPAEPAKPEASEADALKAPEFAGDPTNSADMQAFAKALGAYELKKKLAEGKLSAAEVAAMAKSLTEKEPDDKEAGIEAADSDQVKTLKRQLAKAQRASNAPESKDKGEQAESEEVRLAKAAKAEGAEIAKFFRGAK